MVWRSTASMLRIDIFESWTQIFVLKAIKWTSSFMLFMGISIQISKTSKVVFDWIDPFWIIFVLHPSYSIRNNNFFSVSHSFLVFTIRRIGSWYAKGLSNDRWLSDISQTIAKNVRNLLISTFVDCFNNLSTNLIVCKKKSI